MKTVVSTFERAFNLDADVIFLLLSKDWTVSTPPSERKVQFRHFLIELLRKEAKGKKKRTSEA